MYKDALFEHNTVPGLMIYGTSGVTPVRIIGWAMGIKRLR